MLHLILFIFKFGCVQAYILREEPKLLFKPRQQEEEKKGIPSFQSTDFPHM